MMGRWVTEQSTACRKTALHERRPARGVHDQMAGKGAFTTNGRKAALRDQQPDRGVYGATRYTVSVSLANRRCTTRAMRNPARSNVRR